MKKSILIWLFAIAVLYAQPSFSFQPELSIFKTNSTKLKNLEQKQVKTWPEWLLGLYYRAATRLPFLGSDSYQP